MNIELLGRQAFYWASLVLSLACIALPETSSAAPQDESAKQGWPSDWVTSVATIHGGSGLVAATADGLLMREATVVQVDVADLAKTTTLYRHPVSVWDVVVTETRIASSDYRGNLSVHDRSTGETTFFEGAFERWTRALAVSADGENLVAGNEAGKLFVWSFAKGAVTQTAEVDAKQIYSLRFSADGTKLVAGDGGGHVHVLGWPELNNIRTLELGEQPVWAVAFAQDGTHVIAGGADRKLWKVALEEGSQPVVLTEAADWISSMAVDPDGQAMIATTLGGDIYSIKAGGAEVIADVKLPSGVWDVTMPSSTQIMVATRKHAIAALGQAWEIRYAAEPSKAGTQDESPEAK
jgi:WD40 repeat protein